MTIRTTSIDAAWHLPGKFGRRLSLKKSCHALRSLKGVYICIYILSFYDTSWAASPRYPKYVDV